jgi:hypothetical protein
MSTAIETLPSRHKVSWKGWVIALAAAALLAGAIGTYMALQNGSPAAPSIVQTVKPSIPAIPVKNLQPGAPAAGPQIAEMRDVGGITGTVTQPTSGQTHQGKTGSADTSSGTSSSTPGSPPPNCLRGGPC